jgi:hypothetical protein
MPSSHDRPPSPSSLFGAPGEGQSLPVLPGTNDHVLSSEAPRMLVVRPSDLVVLVRELKDIALRRLAYVHAASLETGELIIFEKHESRILVG